MVFVPLNYTRRKPHPGSGDVSPSSPSNSGQGFLSVSLLVEVLKLAVGTTAQIVSCAVANACLPRVPPRNYSNNTSSRALVVRSGRGGGTKSKSTSIQDGQYKGVGLAPAEADNPTFAFTHVDSPLNMEDYVNVKLVFDLEVDKEVIVFEDVPAMLSVPTADVSKPESEPQAQQLLCVHLEQLCIAPSKGLVVSDADFSIYTPVSSPSKKAMYITPMHSPLLTVKDVNFTVLKAASDHVAEILRENRRRLDAGEDPNVARREARRKRAQELASPKFGMDL